MYSIFEKIHKTIPIKTMHYVMALKRTHSIAVFISKVTLTLCPAQLLLGKVTVSVCNQQTVVKLNSN